jgi:hypothetical protein
MRMLLIHFISCFLLKHPSHILLYRYGQCLQIDGEIFPFYFFMEIPPDTKLQTVSLFRWDNYRNVWGKCYEWWTGKCLGGHIEDNLRTLAWKGRNCDKVQLETRHRDLPSKNLPTISNHWIAHSVTWQCGQFGSWLDFLLSWWFPWIFAVEFPALPSNFSCDLLPNYFTLIIITHLCHLGLGL